MKKLSAKIGEYEKEGQTKGRYVNLGVIQQSNDGGEYVLLDPTVSVSGILAAQNALAASKGQPVRDRVMVGVFEDQQNYQQQPQQAPQQAQNQAINPAHMQQPQQQPRPMVPPNQQGVSQPQQQQPQQPAHGFDDFDDDIPL